MYCFLISLISFFLLGAPSIYAINEADCLKAHNEVRAKANNGEYFGQPKATPPLIPLVWDIELAESAKASAQRCVWQHSSDRENIGENLYSATGKSATIFDAVSSWAEEHKDYNFETRECLDGRQCGHYTQLVWQDTVQVGCAACVCSPLRDRKGNELFKGFAESTFIVCHYRPAGNYRGHTPYKIDKDL